MMVRKFTPAIVAPALLVSLGLLGPLGCAGPSTKPLSSSLFVNSGEMGGSDVPLIAGPATTISELQKPLPATAQSPQQAMVLPAEQAPSALPDVKPIDALSTPPTTEPVTTATTEPSAAPANDAAPAPSAPVVGQGVYMTLGGVVAIVNDKPIYAQQILNPIDRELTVKARQLAPREFEQFAVQEIGAQFEKLVSDERDFALAYRALSEDDRKLALAIMVHARQERINKAGGSVELARQQSLDAGEDFDDALNQEYHTLIQQLYYQRKIEPLIQVTAQDMREFYRLNVDKLFSDKDRARFRVIEVDPETAGGISAAMDKINGLRDRAMHGEDFAALATNFSDDPIFKKTGGSPTDPGQWMDRNTFPNDAVDAAIWQIEPGQITPVLKYNGKLYIAKLEAKHIGSIKPFDDEKVQEQISAQLRQKQATILNEHSREESLANGIIDTSEDRMQITLDMAMQKYAAAK
jgi:parvulin-like peptidyl-prolyl isomerase